MHQQNKDFRLLDRCRLCSRSSLSPFVDFGEVPLGNNLQSTAERATAAQRFRLDIMRCGNCGHFQLGCAVAPSLLYATNYTYLSGVGASFVEHIENYTTWIHENCDLPQESFVVDIGSNDGTCLKAFRARGHRVCGVDPASLAVRVAREQGIPTINSFFDYSVVEEIIRDNGRADLVTSQNVLAHVDNLAATFRCIYDLLKEGGFFAFEIGYFREVLQQGCFDTIYHEHLDYHHAGPLARHLLELGFDLLDISVNSVQGGSLRLLLKKTGCGNTTKQAQDFLSSEKKSVLYDEAFLKNWFGGIKKSMLSVQELLARESRRGSRIVAYGAPTKATLLAYVSGLDSASIAFVVEDNPYKVGCYLPGSAIPVRGPSDLMSFKPELIVIFAWNFHLDIINKLRSTIDYPVKVVIPLPKLEVINL